MLLSIAGFRTRKSDEEGILFLQGLVLALGAALWKFLFRGRAALASMTYAVNVGAIAFAVTFTSDKGSVSLAAESASASSYIGTLLLRGMPVRYRPRAHRTRWNSSVRTR